jgi:hypothetical protein
VLDGDAPARRVDPVHDLVAVAGRHSTVPAVAARSPDEARGLSRTMLVFAVPLVLLW